MHKLWSTRSKLLAPALVFSWACSGPSAEDAGLAEVGETGACPSCAVQDARAENGDGGLRFDGEGPGVSTDASDTETSAPMKPDAATGLDAATGEGGSGVIPPPGPGACPSLTNGWTAYQATATIQFMAAGTNNQYCTYWNDGGVEYFQLDKNPAMAIQRCEARVNNDYASGKNQFEGDVRVTAGNNVCVHQVFNFLMIVAYPQNGGEFHRRHATFLESGVFGRWVHVNTIHDTAAHTADIYLDCAHKLTMSDSAAPSAAGWYDKYGLYGIQGLPPAAQTSITEWANVTYYRQP